MEAAAWAQVDAAWAQAILSVLAILASGGIAVLVPHLDRRATRAREECARLDITTTRSQPNGLRLDIRYVPEFTNAAIAARITVKSPGVRLMRGRPVLNPAPMASGGYLRYEFDGECVEGVGTIGLAQRDDQGAFVAVMFLLPDVAQGWVLKDARIEVTITNAGGDHLLTRTLFVSPIEEGPGTVFVEPASIRLGLG